MIICLDQRTDAGCGAANRDGAQHCAQCGRPLRFALALANPGAQLGPYRILRVLGHGGDGAVYEAEIVGRPDMHVAIKETFDPSSINGFQEEFTILRRLQHANLPRYFEMFELNSNGYLVMELVAGQSLQTLIDQRQGPLTESQVLGYALQLCDVLEYLHGLIPPILHRDIKPANIRLTPEGQIKLVDFGLLKRAGQRTRRTIRGFGTPAYAPLEQYGQAEHNTDVRSDIYALGATLYHLLTGQEPPAATSRAAVSPDPLSPPQNHHPGLSRAVAEAIMSALALAQTGRPANVAAFRQALLGAAPQAAGVGRAGPGAPVAAHLLRTMRAADSIMGIAWSRDGRTLASANSDATVCLWNMADGRLDHVLQEHTDVVTSVAYSPDGRLLAAGGTDGKVCLWHTDDWDLISSLSWRVERSTSVAFSPNGQVLASGSADGSINLWRIGEDGSNGVIVWPLKHNGGVLSIVWSPDGQVFASAGMAGTIRFWRVAHGVLLGELSERWGAVNSLAWSPDGLSVAHAGADGTLLLRRLEYHDPTQSRHAHGTDLRWLLADFAAVYNLSGHNGGVSSVAWNPNGRLLASGGSDQTVRLWRASDGALLRTLPAHREGVESVAWSPDGRLLASAGWDKAIQVWQIDET